MAESGAILYDPKLRKSMDYQALRKEGIRYAQQLSGEIWTDYNEHDPGVTILEQFCYALTDVAYRTNIDIEKLLFFEGDPAEISHSNTLYSPHEILPCGALTITDYRKLIIDRVKEVNDVWLRHHESTGNGIKGLYNVVLKLSNDNSSAAYGKVKKKVRKLLAQHRNLCEDIHEITVLEPLPVHISFRLEVSTDVVVEELLAEIFYRLDQVLNPQVKFYSFEELTDQGINLMKIFESPSFRHGFIKDDDLKEQSGSIPVSNISECVSGVEGVRNVRELVIGVNGVRVYGDAINIGHDQFAVLGNVRGMGRSREDIEVSKGNISYDYDQDMVMHLFDVKQDRQKRTYEIKRNWNFNQMKERKNLKELFDFYSIQNTFPGVYGIGHCGLPDDATKERKAKARQLQGYLLFFDQILANHLAQLKNVRALFSIDTRVQESYSGLLPVDLPGSEYLIGFKKTQGKEANEFIQSTVVQFDTFESRKNRILNHLLARFGERFSDELDGSIRVLFGDLSKKEIEKQLIKLKTAFLKHYVNISRNRAKAYNYLRPSWDTHNIPAFKTKVCLLLNIPDDRQRSLVDHYGSSGVTKYAPGEMEVYEGQYKAKNKPDTTYKAVTGKQGKATFLVRDKQVIEYLVRYGLHQSNYKIEKDQDTGKYIILFAPDKREAPVRVYETDTLQQANQVKEQLVSYFHNISFQAEGFHLVEHILLRPLRANQYYFNMLDPEGDNVLLKSIEPGDLTTQREIAYEVPVLAADRSNYERRQVKSGKHILVLKDRHGQALARFSTHFPSEAGAAKEIDRLVQYFKSIVAEGTSYKSRISFEAEVEDRPNVGESFYNHKLSIVLPAWVSRFQNQEFEMLLKNSLRVSLPAHLCINFAWLGVHSMREFEGVYQQWLELKQQMGNDGRELDDLSYQLINILTKNT